jgi:hypothetical protein
MDPESDQCPPPRRRHAVSGLATKRKEKGPPREGGTAMKGTELRWEVNNFD